MARGAISRTWAIEAERVVEFTSFSAIFRMVASVLFHQVVTALQASWCFYQKAQHEPMKEERWMEIECGAKYVIPGWAVTRYWYMIEST